MTTQDLNTLQEIADLLRSGRIVSVRFTFGSEEENFTWTPTLLSIKQFENLIDVERYRDIKILFPVVSNGHHLSCPKCSGYHRVDQTCEEFKEELRGMMSPPAIG